MRNIKEWRVVLLLLLITRLTNADLLYPDSAWFPYYSQNPAIPSTFQGSELLGAYPYINTDLLLLQQRSKINLYNAQHHLLSPDYLRFLLGGRVQVRAYQNDTFAGKTLQDLYLYKAEIYNELILTPWLTGFAALAYDSNTNAPGVSDPQHLFNEPIFFDRAFITLGNLNKSPFYNTTGLFWAPFGIYNTFMLTPPLTRLMSFTKVTGSLIGYAEHGVSMQLYSYKGSTRVDGEGNDLFNQLGFNVDYNKSSQDASWNIGGGLISNMADSNGMQDVKGNSGFKGFGSSWDDEQIDHYVPAMNVHGKLNIHSFSFIGEWNAALIPFAVNNLSFDQHGAKPQAWTVETGYHFAMMDKPMVLAIGYGQTSQALALNLAEKRYVATLTGFLWRHTREKLEFKHELNYPLGSTATGQGTPSANTHSLGKSSNTITAEFSWFF